MYNFVIDFPWERTVKHRHFIFCSKIPAFIASGMSKDIFFRLFDDVISISDRAALDFLMVANWKPCGRKWSWPNIRCYLEIFLKGRRKSTENLSPDSRCLFCRLFYYTLCMSGFTDSNDKTIRE
jgi:hypothetical protein